MAEDNIISIAIEKMDLAKPNVIPIVRMMQDDKVGRKITVGLYENGNAWNPPESVSAQVQYSKPDGTGGLYDSIPGYRDTAWEFEENKLAIFIAPQVTSCPGIVELAVRIIKDEFQFSTFAIKIDVQKTPGINVKSDNFVSVNGLLPAVGWKANKILATDENGKVIAKDPSHETDPAYIIDATAAVKVNFTETVTRTYALTDIVDVDELLAAHEAGREIQLKMGIDGNDAGEFTAKLDDYYEVENKGRFSGFVAWNTVSYSIFHLYLDRTDGSVWMHVTPNPMGAVVKTVNGVGPDEDGNVEVETAEEKPVHMGFEDYYAGTIHRDYADGGSSDIAVTFDENGNPIKFSNGVEEFTVTWPAEEVTS